MSKTRRAPATKRSQKVPGVRKFQRRSDRRRTKRELREVSR